MSCFGWVTASGVSASVSPAGLLRGRALPPCGEWATIAAMGIAVALTGGCSSAPKRATRVDAGWQSDAGQPRDAPSGNGDLRRGSEDGVGFDTIMPDGLCLQGSDFSECDLRGNSNGGCIEVVPEVSFGSKLWGATSYEPLRICSCHDSTEPVLLYAIELTNDSSLSAWFGLRLGSLHHSPSFEDPVVLVPGQCANIGITFFADQAAPVISSCDIPWERGELIIWSNTSEGETKVALRGVGIFSECSTAVISCDDCAEVIAGTMLQLFGSGSSSPRSPIARWNWEVVEMPNLSTSAFVPSNEAPDPSFVADSPGTYRLELTVEDCYGVGSCMPAELEVLAAHGPQ